MSARESLLPDVPQCYNEVGPHDFKPLKRWRNRGRCSTCLVHEQHHPIARWAPARAYRDASEALRYTAMSKSMFPFRRWHEGKHAQIEVGRVALWAGVKADRLMVGVVFNVESLTFGVGVGPLYAGIGAAYDR